MCVKLHCTAFVCGVFVQFGIISHISAPFLWDRSVIDLLRQSHYVDITSFYMASNVFAFYDFIV